MCKVEIGAEIVDHVGGPVPAVRRFDHHLGIWAGLGERLSERHGAVVDADAVDQRAVCILSDDDAAPGRWASARTR